MPFVACETARRYSNEDQKVEKGIEEKGAIEGILMGLINADPFLVLKFPTRDLWEDHASWC